MHLMHKSNIKKGATTASMTDASHSLLACVAPYVHFSGRQNDREMGLNTVAA
jgi:hypothetical protein